MKMRSLFCCSKKMAVTKTAFSMKKVNTWLARDMISGFLWA